MDEQRLSWLVAQYMADTATPQEMQELTSLVHAGTDMDLFQSVLTDMMQQESPAAPRRNELWQQMVQQIVAIDKTLEQPVRKRTARIAPLYKWAAAAVVLVFASWALYYYLLPSRQPVDAGYTTLPLVHAPVNKNVLILADGSSIFPDELPDGRIATQDAIKIIKRGSTITYSTKAQINQPLNNTLSTARSNLYQLVLPDGSQVWLNAASSIRFPVSFDGRERLVELSGEAWFDVQHADKIPFFIRSGAITTAVIGTAFNIKAYPGQQSMLVAVQRGVVKIQSGKGTLTTLVKGQQIRVAANNRFTVSAIDTTTIAAWKQGNLVYKDETVKDIVTDLQRVFNDSIVIKRLELQRELITVSFNKNAGTQQALEIICRIIDARLTKQQAAFVIE